MGKYLPGGVHLLMIHEKFGVSPTWLLTDLGEMFSNAHPSGVAESDTQYGSASDSMCGWTEEQKASMTVLNNYKMVYLFILFFTNFRFI